MNKVILKGRIGSDVDVKDINGVKCARFSLATSKRYKDKDGNNKELTQWHNCIAWRQVAETIGKFFAKGSEILLEGEIQYRQWETDRGEKRTSTDIVVEGFEFCGSRESQPTQSSTPVARQTPRVQSTPISAGVSDDGDLPF